MDKYKELKSAFSMRSLLGYIKLTDEQYKMCLDAIRKVYGDKCPMCEDCPHGCKLERGGVDGSSEDYKVYR